MQHKPSIDKYNSALSSEVEATMYGERLTNAQIIWLGRHLVNGREMLNGAGTRYLALRPKLYEDDDKLICVSNFTWLIRQNEIVYPLDDIVFRHLFSKINNTAMPPISPPFPAKGYPIKQEEYPAKQEIHESSLFTTNFSFIRELWE